MDGRYRDVCTETDGLAVKCVKMFILSGIGGTMVRVVSPAEWGEEPNCLKRILEATMETSRMTPGEFRAVLPNTL